MQHTYARTGDGYDFVVSQRQVSFPLIFFGFVTIIGIPLIVLRMLFRLRKYKFRVAPNVIQVGGKTLDTSSGGEFLLRNTEQAGFEAAIGPYTTHRMVVGPRFEMANYNFAMASGDVARGILGGLAKAQHKVSFVVKVKNPKGKKLKIVGGLKIGDAEALINDVHQASAGSL